MQRCKEHVWKIYVLRYESIFAYAACMGYVQNATTPDVSYHFGDLGVRWEDGRIIIKWISGYQNIRMCTGLTHPTCTLSRVYGSVTNKNRILDGMIVFINTFFYNLS
jgi:hypothetical protein